MIQWMDVAFETKKAFKKKKRKKVTVWLPEELESWFPNSEKNINRAIVGGYSLGLIQSSWQASQVDPAAPSPRSSPKS